VSKEKKKKDNCGTYYYLNKWGVWMLHDRLDPCEDKEECEEVVEE